MLHGKRILIIEDEPLIALDLQTTVTDFGGVVVGPVCSLAEAEAHAASGSFDGAILDLRLRDGIAIPVADALAARGIPFVIHSGQTDSVAASEWPEVPIISKPTAPEDVISALALAMAKR